MKTPLEELINDTIQLRDRAKIYSPVDVIIYQSFINQAELLLQKESNHTEEIAIGFSKWKYNTNWILIGISESGELMYGNAIVEQSRKTDKELFSDYMKTI